MDINKTQYWEQLFNKYCELEKKCLNYINSINDIKQNLIRLLGEQKKDDVSFYKSIIDNSFFYLNSSMKIRKTKFLNDLTSVWIQIDSYKEMNELNTSNFQTLLKDYTRMVDNINYMKQNNTALLWVKNDKIESLTNIEKDMNDIMKYHTDTLEYFLKFIKLEKDFYCGNDKDSLLSFEFNDKYIKKQEYNTMTEDKDNIIQSRDRLTRQNSTTSKMSIDSNDIVIIKKH